MKTLDDMYNEGYDSPYDNLNDQHILGLMAAAHSRKALQMNTGKPASKTIDKARPGKPDKGWDLRGCGREMAQACAKAPEK